MAIQVSVVAALSDSGFLNAGMPFEIASTPVKAVQPAANARIISQISTHPDNCVVLKVPHRFVKDVMLGRAVWSSRSCNTL